MTPKESRKIAQDMQHGLFLKLALEEQLRIRELLRIGALSSFVEYRREMEE